MSLFDEADNKTETTPEVNSDSPSWYWDANTPGTGERPDFLSNKYKSVADMAKAQKELEKRLGVAPEKYDLSKGNSWIEEENANMKKMTEFAKNKHVPQEVMDVFLESVGSYLGEFTIDATAEKAKLGANAEDRIQKLNNWAKSNLSDKAYKAISANMRTAESVEALEELRTKMLAGSNLIPTGTDSVASRTDSLASYRSELKANYEKYKKDPHYRKTMETRLSSIMGED